MSNGGLLLQGSVQQVIKDDRLNADSDRGQRVTIEAFASIKRDVEYLQQDCKKSISYTNLSSDFAVLLQVTGSCENLWAQTDNNGEQLDRILLNQRRVRRMSTLGTRTKGRVDTKDIVKAEMKLGDSGVVLGEGKRQSHQLQSHQSMRLMPKDLARQMAGSVRWYPTPKSKKQEPDND